MKKKYFNFGLNLCATLKPFYLVLIVLIALFIETNLNAQVAITKPNLSIPACSGFPSGYNALGNIVITESENSNFSSNASPLTLVLTAPANFEFNPGVGAVAVVGGNNLSAASIVVTTATITITYTCSQTNKPDTMTISGLQIRAINTASTGNITRTGGTGVINNLGNGTTLTNTLTSTATPIITTQPTATSVCTNGTTTFNVAATGAATYQWRKNGVAISAAPYTGFNSSTLTVTNPTVGENGALFDVVISSSAPACSVTSSPAILTVNTLSVAPTSISGASTICAGGSTTLTLSGGTAGTGATAEWFSGSCGGTSAGTGNSITVSPALNTTYFVRYKGTCNTTSCTSVAVTVNPYPVSAGTISGVYTVCQGQGLVAYSVPAITNATSYSWNYSGTGATISGSTNSVSITFAANATSGDLSVYGVNACGNGIVSANYPITVNPLPIAAQTISGVSPVCQGQGSVAYSVPAITNATSYAWAYSGTGATISGSTNSVSITFAANATSGNLSVYGVNACGNGTVSANYPITVNPLPIAAQTISGVSPVCQGQGSVAYSVPAITNATSYSWNYSGTGATISGSTNSVSITFAANATSGDLSVYGVNACGNGIVSANYPITVNPLPTTAQTISGVSTVCQGQGSVAYSVPAITNATSYSWNYSGTGATISGSTNSVTISFAANATSGNLSVYGINACGNGIVSANYSITVNPLPVISSQPTSSTVCTNGTTSFTVSATGTSTFQWRKNGLNLTDNATYSGATTATLTITNPSKSDDGAIFDVVLNGATCPVTSTTATLTIFEKVLVTSQPISSQIFCEGGSATIKIIATGDGLSFQWFKGSSPISDGGTISGATSPTLTISPLVLGDGATYHCVVSGTSPCNAVISNNSILNVNQGPVIISPPAVSQTVCTGDSVSFSVGATIGSLSYQWYKGATALVNGGAISGVNSATLTINPVNATDADADYNCVVSNGCFTETRSSELIVNPTPNAVSTNSAQTICSASAIATMVISGNVSGTTFNWTRDNTVSATGIAATGSGDISGSLTNATNAPVTVTFTITPTTNACSGTPITATIIVNPTAQVNLTTNQVVCNGNPTNVVNFGTINTGGTANYSWTNDTASIGLAATGNGNISSFTAVNNGTTPVTATIVVTPTFTNGSVGCTGPTKTFTITVNPTAQVNPINSQVVCNGSSSTVPAFETINTIGTTTYSWTNSDASIGLAASGTGNIPVFTAKNTGTSPVVGTIVVTPTFTNGGSSCSGATQTFTITVNPTAQVNLPTNQVLCNGSSSTLPAFATLNTIGTTTYSWTNSAASIGLAASGTGNIPVFTATNTGTSPAVATIVVTPTFTNGGTSCSGATQTFTITVNPTAQVNLPANQVLCNGSSSTLPAFATINTIGTTTYSWTNSAASIGLAASGTGNIPEFTATNAGTSPVVTTIVVTPTFTNGGTSCSGSTQTFTITVNPTAQVNLPTNQVFCNGSSSTLPAFATINTIGTTTYSWTNSNASIGLAASGTGNIPVFTATNTGTSPVVATIVVTPTFTNGGTSCSGSTQTFTITVNPAAQVNLPTNQVFCNGSSSTVPAFTTINTIGTTTYSWTNSTASIGLAASGTGNIPVFTATNAGTSPVVATIVVTPTFNNGSVNCAGSSKTFTITIDPNPKGGILSFGATGRIFLSCIDPNPNAAVVVVNPVKLDLTGIVGTIVKWEYRTSTATSWSVIPEGAGNFTGTSLSASQINNLKITASTVFRVEISSGACKPNVYSETAIISVIPTNIKPSPVSVNKKVICIGEGVQLSSETGYGDSFGKFEGGAFDNSSITNSGWLITDQFGNTNYNFSSDADNIRPDKWLRTNPHAFPTADITSPYTIRDKIWDTSLNSAGNKGFAIVSGNHTSTLETAVFSLGPLDEAILTFDQAYNLTPGATIKVEISINGGTPYTSEPILYQQSGAASSGNYDHFGQGTAGINQMEIDLGDYIGYSNLRIRFSYTGVRDGDIWALDNIKVPEGPRDVNLQWTDTTDPSNPIIIGTTNNVTWTPTKIGWNNFVVKTALILDSAGNTCSSPVNQEEVKVFAFDQYTTTTVVSAEGCGSKTAPLSATVVGGKQGAITSYPTPDGYVGEWSIQGPVGFVLSNPDQSTTIDPKNNPKAIFTAANLGDYTFNWILVPTNKDENGQIILNTTCTPNYIGPNLSIQDCTTLDFDGVDDYVDLGTGYNGTYSIEAWIRPYPRLKADGTFTDASKGTIISTKNLEINMSDLPSSVVPNKRWYHIAVDTDGKLYVDGINVNKTISARGTDRAFIGARWTPPNTDNHFSGWIEEVRIWDGKITEDQIRFTMNQRLQNNANIGVEIPMPAPGFGFGTLKGYYQLLIGTITNGGYTPDNSTIPVNGKLRNMTSWQENTAPLPYTSANDGDWNVMSTWTQPVVWDYPNSVGIDAAKTRIDWNIVKISNNIKSVEAGGKDGITLLGLKSISGKLTMAAPAPAPQNETNTGRMLWITHYLKLDGNIDLVGESQLLQKRYGSYDSDFNFSSTQVNESILEEASLGYIERDQQGQRNSYNYNYWSSPVSIRGGANNAPYSVIGVAKDGTNSVAPGLISFNDGAYFADGALSSPIKTSNRWMWSYNAPVQSTAIQNYNQWNYLGSTGFLKTGEGFTMKGTGGTAATNVTQNYVFIGKPNNATISLPLPLNQIYLVGNPYPSALDANEFIRNNLKDCAGCTATQNVFNGTLYFWDHFGVTNNHILAQYTGGYAAYNLSGGVPGIANSVLTVNNNSSGSRSPKRYIPVAQGFFIDAPLGTAVAAPLLNFHNNQRVFERESPESSVFMKSVGNKKTQIIDARSKIRLGFDSFIGIHRQLLVTADSNTTSGYDIGYDAPMFDLQKNDIYWEINNNAYVIQGINNFNEDQVIPLGITIADKGPITIKIDELENITESTKIFLFDTLTATYHDIRDKAFSISLAIGEYKNRFSILFLNKTLSVEENILNEQIEVLYASNYKTLIIQNKIPDTTVKDVYLINLLGQTIDKWDVEDTDQTRIQLPVKNFASGVYIVKLKTSTGEMSQKIIIK